MSEHEASNGSTVDLPANVSPPPSEPKPSIEPATDQHTPVTNGAASASDVPSYHTPSEPIHPVPSPAPAPSAPAQNEATVPSTPEPRARRKRPARKAKMKSKAKVPAEARTRRKP